MNEERKEEMMRITNRRNIYPELNISSPLNRQNKTSLMSSNLKNWNI